MGWWGNGIMCGDEPLDIEGDYNDRFEAGSVITSADTINFIAELCETGYCDHIAKQVVGFIVMSQGLAMSEDLRAVILDGIQEELAEIEREEDGWNSPQERKDNLIEFRQLTQDYPAGGGKVEMPEQIGLFDRIYAELGRLG